MALGLGLHRLDGPSLWLDEAHSFFAAQHNWLEPWTAVPGDSLFMSLYFVILNLWLSLGTSELVIRGLGVVFWSATVPIVYLLARDVAGRRAGVAAALLTACQPFLLEYAQEARSYTLLALLATCSTLSFMRAMARGSRDWWGVYAVASALSVYAHLFGALVVATHVAVFRIHPSWRTRWRSAITVWVLIGLAWLPLFVLIARRGTGSLSWIPSATIADLVEGMRQIAGGSGWLLLALLSLSTVVAIGCFRRRHVDPAGSWQRVTMLSAAFGPIATTFLLSAVKPAFLDRYLILSVPPLMAVGAVGLAAVSPRLLGAAGAVALVLLQLRSTEYYYASVSKEDWRGATRHVVQYASPDDGIVFYARYVRQPVEYYIGQLDAELGAPIPIYPTPPWGEYRFGVSEGIEQDQALAAADTGLSRLWLVLAHTPVGSDREEIIAWAERDHDLIDSRAFEGGIVILLFERVSIDR